MHFLKEFNEILQPPPMLAFATQVGLLEKKSIPQGVLNFLYHADKLSLEEAGEILLVEAKLRLESHEIMWFFDQYVETQFKYYQDPRLKFSSFRFDEGIFKSNLEPWLNGVLTKKDQFLPLIISNMLKGDEISKSLYESIYASLDKKDLIWNSYKPELSYAMEYCLNENNNERMECILCKPSITAQYWLNSTEGHDVLCSWLIHAPKFELLLDYPC